MSILVLGKRELVALLNLSSWCLVMVECLFLAMPWGCLRFVIVILPDHTHLLFSIPLIFKNNSSASGGKPPRPLLENLNVFAFMLTF